jgi:hypothetical protein
MKNLHLETQGVKGGNTNSMKLMIDLFETIAQAAKPCDIPFVISRFDNYNKSVMQRAWKDYKIKKVHKGYEDWTFAESLHHAHRTIKALRKNGL